MAIPGILQQLAMNNPLLQNAKQMIGMLKGVQNPQAMLNQMMSNNPQMKQVMDVINQYGGDAKKAFYTLAEQKGIDPNEILNMMK